MGVRLRWAAVFTEGSVTSVTTTATGPAPIVRTRDRFSRDPDHVGSHRDSVLLVAAIAYLPMLFTRIGKVALDTNDGVYLDTARTLRLAGGRWDPGLMFGSVIDRTDGYAFPMAPWFWLARWLQMPTWVAQRLWLGTIVFLAGLGVLVLVRTMRWEGTGAFPGALAYMLSPYAMQYLGTRSVVLLAWAGLPWLIHFAARSTEAPGWAYPARFALGVSLATGGNLAASLYMLVGPALWYVFVGFVTRDVSLRTLLRTIARVAIVTAGVCVWLVVGWTYAPRVELGQALARDPLSVTSRATTPSEVIRGLGDWRVYTSGRGSFAVQIYPRWPAMIALTAVVTAIGLGGLALARFRNRLYFIGLLVAGMTLSVGAAPVSHREATARLFARLTSTSLGGVLAPSSRAAPLHLLAIALGFGAATRAVIRYRNGMWWTAHVLSGALIAATVPGLFLGRAIDSPLLLANGVPSYWRQAATALNQLPGDFNVLEVPGQDSSSYVWGTTNRPISASLLRNPVGLRSTPTIGQRPTRDLVAAIDDQLRNHTLQPHAVAPLARMMAVGAIVVRADDADSRIAAEALKVLGAAQGIVLVGTFGDAQVGTDGITVFRVEDVPARLQVFQQADVAVVAADGRGLVDLANASLLPTAQLMISAGALGGQRELSERINPDAAIIVTDANRLERRAAADEAASVGATETIDDTKWGGPLGERLTPRPGETVDSASHVELGAGLRIVSSNYGATRRFEPSDRPTLAFDSDVATGWRVGRNGSPIGERLVIQLPQPVTTTSLSFRQAAGSSAGRSITRVHLEFDGLTSRDVALRDPQLDERVAAGETITFGTTTFRTLAIEITAVADGDASAGAGFVEIEVPGVAPVTETVVLPDDLLRFGGGLATHPVTVAMTRWRDVAHGDDPEREIRRAFDLPTEMTFDLTGHARPAPGIENINAECRSDLVVVNGEPVPVRLSVDAAGLLAIAGCASVTVGPGVVTVSTARLAVGAGREIAVDRLAFVSTGDALQAPAAAAPPPPDVKPEVAINGTTELEIKLPKASSGVWLFRAAGASDGWTATVDDVDLTRSFLANGFGLAWPLEVGDGARHQVGLRIPAQRRVSIAVIASTITGLIALVLASRRRPAIVEPERPSGAIIRPRRVPVGVVSLVAIVVLGMAGGAIPGLAAGAVTMGIDYRRSIARTIAWVGVLLMFATGVARAVWQLTTSTPVTLAWPGAAPVFDVLTWTSIAIVVAVGVGTASNRERARRPGDPPRETFERVRR